MELINLKIETSKSSFKLAQQVLTYISGDFFATCKLVNGELNADDLIEGIDSFASLSTKKTYPAMCKALIRKIEKAVADYNLELQASKAEEARIAAEEASKAEEARIEQEARIAQVEVALQNFDLRSLMMPA